MCTKVFLGVIMNTGVQNFRGRGVFFEVVMVQEAFLEVIMNTVVNKRLSGGNYEHIFVLEAV